MPHLLENLVGWIARILLFCILFIFPAIIARWPGPPPLECIHCGYDLRGTTGEQCSECGRRIA